MKIADSLGMKTIVKSEAFDDLKKDWRKPFITSIKTVPYIGEDSCTRLQFTG